MNGRLADDTGRRWNTAMFGADCLKLMGNTKKYRSTRVFIHPTMPSLLCWLSKWKSNQDAGIELSGAEVDTPASVEAFGKEGRGHFLVVKSSKRALTLSFGNKREFEDFVAVIRDIAGRLSMPMSLRIQHCNLDTIDDRMKQAEEEFKLNNMKYNSQRARRRLGNYCSGAPVIDGYPEFYSKLVECNNLDYLPVTSATGYPFKSYLPVSQQGKAYTENQIESKPWFLSQLSEPMNGESELAAYLFSPMNDVVESCTTPLKLSECLFKTCRFSSVTGDSLVHRIERALNCDFRWFCLNLSYESTFLGDNWRATAITGDPSARIDDLIEHMIENAFSQTSMPVVLRFNLEQSDRASEKLSGLSEHLIATFGSQVVVTPGFYESIEVEKLRFKILIYFMVPGTSEGQSSELPDRLLPTSLLGTLISDFESQEGQVTQRASLKKISLTSNKESPGNSKRDLSNGKSIPKLENPTLKKLNLGEEIAYSFASSDKEKKSQILKSKITYNQIEGISPEDGLEDLSPDEQLSISPTRVRRTPIADIRRSRHSMGLVDSFKTLYSNRAEDLINTGCFNTVRINTGVQLDRLSKNSPAVSHNKVGLISLSEVLVSKMSGEIGALFKHESLLEIVPNEASYGPRLDLNCIKRAVLWGLNMYPIDADRVPEADIKTYDAIFDFLASAAPGNRSSAGVVSVKRFRDHFKYLKFNMLRKMQFSFVFIGAFKLAQLFFLNNNHVPGQSNQKKKVSKHFIKLEFRFIDCSEAQQRQLAACNCEYYKDQELNYDFEQSFRATLIQEPTELKKLKLQVWGISEQGQTSPALICEKTLFPAFMLPGYRSVYFNPDWSSHLAMQIQIFQIE